MAKTQKNGMIDIIANGIRMTLVHMYDDSERLEETFRAGFRTAIEEMSVRFLSQDFDAYEDAVRKQLREEAVQSLAAEFEDALTEEVAAGHYDLIIAPDGKRTYSKRVEVSNG